MEAHLGLDLLMSGRPEHVATGIALLESAAREGHLEAVHNLGVAYEQGIGVHPNARKAMRLYRRAAKLGYVTL